MCNAPQVHERTLQGDFLMALLKDIVARRRALGNHLKVQSLKWCLVWYPGQSFAACMQTPAAGSMPCQSMKAACPGTYHTVVSCFPSLIMVMYPRGHFHEPIRLRSCCMRSCIPMKPCPV